MTRLVALLRKELADLRQREPDNKAVKAAAKKMAQARRELSGRQTTLKRSIGAPLAAYRMSGSLPRLPMIVALSIAPPPPRTS